MVQFTTKVTNRGAIFRHILLIKNNGLFTYCFQLYSVVSYVFDLFIKLIIMKVFWDFLPREFCLHQLAVTKKEDKKEIGSQTVSKMKA